MNEEEQRVSHTNYFVANVAGRGALQQLDDFDQDDSRLRNSDLQHIQIDQLRNQLIFRHAAGDVGRDVQDVQLQDEPHAQNLASQYKRNIILSEEVSLLSHTNSMDPSQNPNLTFQSSRSNRIKADGMSISQSQAVGADYWAGQVGCGTFQNVASAASGKTPVGYQLGASVHHNSFGKKSAGSSLEDGIIIINGTSIFNK